MKTPVLAMLLAGAAAQSKKAREMVQDRAAPVDPVKPGDLEGCTDADVTAAKGKHVGAVQALTGLTDGRKPLAAAVDAKLKLKADAIKAVLAKDATDATAIKADYTAAGEEIASRATYLTKVALYRAAVLAVDQFNGEVAQASANADDAATKDKDESLKNVKLVKAKGGKKAIADAALKAAQAEQKKLSDALADANNNYAHWEKEKGVAEGLTSGLTSTNGSTKLAYEGKKKVVDDLVKDYNDKNGVYIIAKAAYDTKKAEYDKIYAVYTTVKAKIDGSTSAAGDSSSFDTAKTNFIAEAKKLRIAHAAFITQIKLN